MFDRGLGQITGACPLRVDEIKVGATNQGWGGPSLFPQETSENSSGLLGTAQRCLKVAVDFSPRIHGVRSLASRSDA